MKTPDIPTDEPERLARLRSYQILDTEAETAFDDLVKLATDICGTPIGLVSLIDEDRQWFKSRVGLDAGETPRAVAFCAHAVADNRMLVVPDAFKDPRFADNPLVTGAPHVRSYAGALLQSHDGFNLGTLCVISDEPMQLDEQQLEHLQILARQVALLMDMRLHVRELAEARERDARLAGVFRGVHDGIIVIDESGFIEAINPGAERLFGYSPENAIGRNVNVLMPDPYKADHDRYIRSYLDTGEARIIGIGREVTGLRADGTTFPLDLSVSEYQVQDQRKFVGIVRDATDRKRLEQELSQFFGVSLDLLCIANFEGFFTRLNPAWSELLGYSEEELLSRPFVEFVHPEDRDATAQAAAGLSEGGVIVAFQNRYQAKDGSYRWLDWSATSDTELGRIYAVARDITDQIQLRLDLEQLNRELKASNDELEQFAYIVSHDLKAPLRAIANLANWIREDTGEELPDESREHLEILTGRVRRMEALIDGILDYSRVGRGTVTEAFIDTGTIASEVVEALALPDGFSVTIGPNMPVIRGDSTQVQQLFANLVSNACKYHDRDRGHIEIDAEEREGFWVFWVRDDGPGIAPEYHDRIFKIFQTLERRDEVESTGVGLSIVQKIVSQANGHAWVESDGVRGTTFFFSWPLVLEVADD